MGFPFLDWLVGVITLNELTRSSRKREKRSGFKLSSIKAESAHASTQPRIEADRKLGAFAERHSAIRSASGHSRPTHSAPAPANGRCYFNRWGNRPAQLVDS